MVGGWTADSAAVTRQKPAGKSHETDRDYRSHTESESRYPRTILGTACVPWRADWSLDEDLFRAGVRGLIGEGMKHLYVFGTAGEGYAVSDRQFDEITRVFHEETRAPDVHPMVGVINLSLTTIIERIERAAALGFECLPNLASLAGEPSVTASYTRSSGRSVAGFPNCASSTTTCRGRGGYSPRRSMSRWPPSIPTSLLPSTAQASYGQ